MRIDPLWGPVCGALVSGLGGWALAAMNKRKTPGQRAAAEIDAAAASALSANTGFQVLSDEQAKNITRNCEEIRKLWARADEQDAKILARDRLIDRLRSQISRSRRIYRTNIQRLLDHIAALHQMIIEEKGNAPPIPKLVEDPRGAD